MAVDTTIRLRHPSRHGIAHQCPNGESGDPNSDERPGTSQSIEVSYVGATTMNSSGASLSKLEHSTSNLSEAMASQSSTCTDAPMTASNSINSKMSIDGSMNSAAKSSTMETGSSNVTGSFMETGSSIEQNACIDSDTSMKTASLTNLDPHYESIYPNLSSEIDSAEIRIGFFTIYHILYTFFQFSKFDKKAIIENPLK